MRPRLLNEPITVLCVDDDRALAETVAARLASLDDRIDGVAAASAEDALARLDAVDCVVSDYQMPGMDGIELLETVREDYPDLPFVLFTGHGSETVAGEALSAGATDYIKKRTTGDQYELLANSVANAVKSDRLAQQTQAVERVKTLLRRINRALVRAETRAAVETLVCQEIENIDPYQFAWIGRHDEESQRIEPTAWTGVSDDYFDDVTVTTDERPTGRGPGGRAIRTGEVQACQHVAEDDSFDPWRDIVAEQGVEAVCAVPLTYDETVYGLLVVGAWQAYAFDSAERDLLSDLGDDIAYALDSVEIRRELEATDRRFDAVFNNPIAFMAILDPDGTVRDVNEAALAFVDQDVGSVVGDPFPQTPWWSHDASLQSDLRSWIDRAAEGELVRFEADHESPGGDVVTIDGVLHPVRDDGGSVVSILAAGRDISDRKEHEREVERQNERLEAFAEVVSHDLRNPLNVAMGQLTLAQREREQESDHLDAVADALERMTEIIDDVLTMAQAGRTVDEVETVSLSTIVTDCWTNVATDSADLGVVSDRSIEGDPGRLRLVFENLFRNAIEHGATSDVSETDSETDGDAPVTISVGATDGGFFVADDGPGVPTDDRERIFEAGYSSADGGTGLGLNIVCQMVEAHGWEIDIADAETGARFEVTGLGPRSQRG